MNKIIIRDFDGPIIDSKESAFAFYKNNYPGFTDETVKRLFDGNFFQEFKNITGKDFSIDATLTKSDYETFLLTMNAVEGIQDVIHGFQKKGYTQYIVTSNIANLTEFLSDVGIYNCFAKILDGNKERSKIKKIHIVHKKEGGAISDYFFITDTVGDVKEAIEAGISPDHIFAVTRGYHDRERLKQIEGIRLVDKVEELENLGCLKIEVNAIQELGLFLKDQFKRKEGMLYREGPSHVQKELYFDVVVEGEFDGKHVFVKGYSSNSREYFVHELGFTNKINEFATLYADYHISGAKILYYNNEYNYFVMESIKGEKINIKALSLEDIIVLQNRVSNFFKHLKIHYKLPYFVGRHEQSKYAELVNCFIGKPYINHEAIQKLLSGMEKLANSRIANGEMFGFVQKVVGYNSIQIIDYMQQFASQIQIESAINDSIGVLWDGHVYGDVHGNLILIDFDRLVPSLNGYDFTALLFGKLGLNTYVYSDYDDYKLQFMNIFELLKNRIEDKSLVSFLLLQKLIGTIFNDYGRLLLERAPHLEYFSKLGINPEENSKRGIIRNFQLMYDLFNIDYQLGNPISLPS